MPKVHVIYSDFSFFKSLVFVCKYCSTAETLKRKQDFIFLNDVVTDVKKKHNKKEGTVRAAHLFLVCNKQNYYKKNFLYSKAKQFLRFTHEYKTWNVTSTLTCTVVLYLDFTLSGHL